MDIQLLSIREVCDRLGVGRSRLYRFMADGDLVFRKLGGKTVIEAEALEQFVRGLPTAAPPIDQHGSREAFHASRKRGARGS